MIRRAVARTSLPQTPASRSREEFLGSEWLCRPWPEAIEGELCLLTRFDIDKDIVVFLLRRLAFPVKIGRIVGRHLDARATGKDGVLFSATTAQHQVLNPIYIVDFGGVDVPVQHDHLHVLGIRRNQLVWIVGSRDWAQARARKNGIMKDDKGL